MLEVMTHGEEGYAHLPHDERPNADLLWLAARLRLAAARGDSSRIDVPDSLLARREELERVKDGERGVDQAWLEESPDFRVNLCSGPRSPTRSTQSRFRVLKPAIDGRLRLGQWCGWWAGPRGMCCHQIGWTRSSDSSMHG